MAAELVMLHRLSAAGSSSATVSSPSPSALVVDSRHTMFVVPATGR